MKNGIFMQAQSAFSIFFGAKQQSIEPAVCKVMTSRSVLLKESFHMIQNIMNLSSLVFLHQVHGNTGQVVLQEDAVKDLYLFTQEGDFLVTNQPRIGLGIATADCLPIIFIDQKRKVIGAAHAGWKGSLAHIVDEVVVVLQETFSSDLADMQVFFGPAAKGCCYEVDAPFIEQVMQDPLAEQAFVQKQGRYTFDLALYNVTQLYALGFKPEQLNVEYNLCTICNDSFCSYRRQKGSSERQITVVSLK